MTDHVLFQMWGPFRQSLIKGHEFYVEQATKRLLTQFDNIEAEAQRAAEEWLKAQSPKFDPNRHDPGDFYEAANDEGGEFYQLLSDLQGHTRLSVVAGMFHEWDKQLRDWLVREMRNWHKGDIAMSAVWSANFGDLMELLESLGWQVRTKGYFQVLDACRLVVNVYKHGDGKAFRDLRDQYPRYLNDPLGSVSNASSSIEYRDYTNLHVLDENIREFSSGITEFWRNVPENVFVSGIAGFPAWFENSLRKDQAASKGTS